MQWNTMIPKKYSKERMGWHRKPSLNMGNEGYLFIQIWIRLRLVGAWNPPSLRRQETVRDDLGEHLLRHCGWHPITLFPVRQERDGGRSRFPFLLPSRKLLLVVTSHGGEGGLRVVSRGRKGWSGDFSAQEKFW